MSDEKQIEEGAGTRSNDSERQAVSALDHKLKVREALLLLTAEVNAEDWRAAEIAAREVAHQARLVVLSKKEEADRAKWNPRAPWTSRRTQTLKGNL